jgi:hypothetical protein
MFDATDRADRLVNVGLWERVDGGYQIRSWLGWNRSRAEITELQAKDSARKSSSRGSARPEPEPPNGGGQPDDRNPDGVRTESERTSERNPDGIQPHAGAYARTPRHSSSTTDQINPADAGGDDDQPSLIEIEPTKPAKPESRFDEFWALFPRKVKKQGALAAWRKKVLDRKQDQDAILSALRAQIVVWQADPRFPQFVPHPTTWINDARWHDETNQVPLRAVAGGRVQYADPDLGRFYEQ